MDPNTLIQKISKISKSEIIGVLKKDKAIRVYCGYQVSSSLHIGHISGIKILNTLARNPNFKVMVLAADLHMWMNKKRMPDANLYLKIYESFKKLLHPKIKIITGAFGDQVKPNNFQLGPKYFLKVIELSNVTTLARCKRALTADLKNKNETTYFSNLLYPIMQVADIAELKIDVVLGGMDQRKIHMLGRDIFKKLNFKKPVLIHTPLLTNRGKKLSKSLGNGISVGDSLQTINSKLKKYSKDLLVQISNLLDCKPIPEQIADKFFSVDHNKLYYANI